jgi:hypothetical protein
MKTLSSILENRQIIKLNLVVFASMVLSVAATAAPTPITASQLGASTVTFSTSTDLSSNPSPGHFGYAFPYLVCPAEVAGCGGAFRADIKGAASGITIHDATVWCVDSQLDVTVGSSYSADIVSLSNTAALDDPSFTRYGTNGLSPQWVNSIAGYNDSASRYKLVAALVMQLQDSSMDGDYSKPFDNTYNTVLNGLTVPQGNTLTMRNQAIQRAIWWIMYNSVNGTPSPADITGSRSDGVPGGYSDWVEYAKSVVSGGGVNLASWAVVSGPANSVTGALLQPSSGQYQTFLVQLQVTPEPQNLALLIAGLGVIVWFKRRRMAEQA